MHSFFDAGTETYGNACWCPSADIYRGRNGWLVKLDLAGVRTSDIRLRVDGRRIVVEGIRRDYCVLDEQRAYSMEISYNRFRRSLELPCDLTECEVQSEYRDGMFLVLITLQREETAARRLGRMSSCRPELMLGEIRLLPNSHPLPGLMTWLRALVWLQDGVNFDE